MDKQELKEYRDKHHLSQSQLAEIVGVKVGTVQSWEQGKRNIGQSAIKLLQEYDVKDALNEKTPPEEVRMEKLIAKKVVEELYPFLKDFQKGHNSTGQQVHDLTELVKSLVALLIKVKFQVDKNQEDLKKIKEYSREMHEIVSPTK